MAKSRKPRSSARNSGRKTTRSKQAASDNHNMDEGATPNFGFRVPPFEPGSPDSAMTAAETTGRYLVVYRDEVVGNPKEAMSSLKNVAGLAAANIASAHDFDDAAIDADTLADTDAVYLPALGIAVVTADQVNMQGMMAASSDGDSNILAIEPEYVYHATQSFAQLEYLRGYCDAALHMYAGLAYGGATFAPVMPVAPTFPFPGTLPATPVPVGPPPGGSGGPFPGFPFPGGPVLAPVDAAAAAVFQDTPQFTWGLQATNVQTSSRKGQGIRVAVLDTGFDLNHPDFVGRSVVGKSFVTGQTVQDGHGHGTHCIGTSCGPKQPATGVRRYGIAYGAQIYAGKVLANNGSSVGSSVVAGMNWAVTNGCHVISMSLGAGVNSVSQAFETAGQRALNAGSLIIAAAGNGARRSAGQFSFVEQPANSPSIMAVGAVDNQLRVADFSARSSTVTGVAGKVDIAAPGVNVFSSVPVSKGRHATFSGTSMATPHVAGIAALIAEATGLRGHALWNRVISIARSIPGDSRDLGSGLGQAR